MFGWKKDRAHISDEEPTFHVRYLGCTETYIPLGPGCASRHVQKLWDNAPSERHLNQVSVKLGLGGIWLEGTASESFSVPVLKKACSGNFPYQEGKSKSKEANRGRDQIHLNSFKTTSTADKNKNEKGNSVSKRHFKMEDVSFCAADKSVNDRIFCWISRCKHELVERGRESNGTIGPLEVHAVLCSTVGKAETMAAVTSRAFHLAYKEWRAEQQRETRRQQHRKMSTATEGDSDHVDGTDCVDTVRVDFCAKLQQAHKSHTTSDNKNSETHSSDQNGNGSAIADSAEYFNRNRTCKSAESTLVSSSSSSSSIGPTASQRSSASDRSKSTHGDIYQTARDARSAN
ncbi:protein fam43a [Plakobranchus ocellatus]|uniref:Protein fam43a n=1 Tax=Plakobranchus ocellatus TaxID=259542 RepID=A0AAV4BX65_9GAST|nr:protein fam43a [Plakobranchus ocellatus]